MKLNVNLGANSYPIYIENNILSQADTYIREAFRGHKIMIISDDIVYPIYGETLKARLADWECYHMVLPHGEQTKGFQTLPQIYEALAEARFTRTDVIIALGGGVIGDLAGFAAATYMRGIKLVQIPTSLLAQVDSSVGGKVAVDLPQGKNLVGAFFQPSLVLIDPTVLDTLSDRFIVDGMGEVVKYGCIEDASLFETLASHTSFKDLKKVLPEVITRCVDIKREIVEEDQFDTGKRMLLNFGHTLAHTIEQHFNYKMQIHGEAVAIGMYQITQIAEERGLTEAGTAEKILNVLNIYRLPHRIGLPLGSLTQAISLDKKNMHGTLNLILLHNIGSSYAEQTSLQFFNEPKRMI